MQGSKRNLIFLVLDPLDFCTTLSSFSAYDSLLLPNDLGLTWGRPSFSEQARGENAPRVKHVSNSNGRG